MNSNGVRGFVKEHAVIADTQTEQSFKLAAERLDTALAGFRVAVQSLQNTQRAFLFNRADFSGHVRMKAYFLHANSVGRVIADLVHSEAALRNDIFERNADLRILPELLARSSDNAAILFGQPFVFVVKHHFKQLNDNG